MKTIHTLSLICCLCIVFSCRDSSPEVLSLSTNSIESVSYEGDSLRININTSEPWNALGAPDWCSVSNPSGYGRDVLSLYIAPNIEEARRCTIDIQTADDVQQIRIHQEALPQGVELRYRLPIVFQVIYRDSASQVQNPDGEFLRGLVEQVNRMYKHAGEGSVDMNLEFVPATFDPLGRRMKEPGVNRIKWTTEVLEMTDVMLGQGTNHTHFIWEPSAYINVLLYTFDDRKYPEAASVMGVASFPYTPHYAPLRGTESIATDSLKLSNLRYAHCVSLNNRYVKPRSLIFEGYALDRQQTSMASTLAHELGHYLGLYHVFSESLTGECEDTDFCNDTPSYVMSEYEAYLKRLAYRWISLPSFRTDENFAAAFRRSSCQGGEYISRNIMDYAFCYQNQFTPDQRARVRHVLEYSPLMPGPKRRNKAMTRAASGKVDLPVKVMCLPRSCGGQSCDCVQPLRCPN